MKNLRDYLKDHAFWDLTEEEPSALVYIDDIPKAIRDWLEERRIQMKILDYDGGHYFRDVLMSELLKEVNSALNVPEESEKK
jgi:hypothetical protein